MIRNDFQGAMLHVDEEGLERLEGDPLSDPFESPEDASQFGAAEFAYAMDFGNSDGLDI